MMPGFAAERALTGTRGRYRSARGGRAVPGRAVVPQALPSGVSGVYKGTFCLGGVLTVITVDVDENGTIVNWHNADEIGSC
jgi:hypothetical protein